MAGWFENIVDHRCGLDEAARAASREAAVNWSMSPSMKVGEMVRLSGLELVRNPKWRWWRFWVPKTVDMNGEYKIIG